MNRAERRRAEAMAKIREKEQLFKENKEISDRIKKLELEIRDEVSHYYMGLMYTIFILVMRRACGLGKKRMYRVLNELAAVLNDLENEVIDIHDIKREAEEAGMEVKFDVKRNVVVANIFEEERTE
jgi:hypothetical protein